MRIVLLSDIFYDHYGTYPEILSKPERPYACLTVKVDGLIFAIPFRHHINHKFAYITYGQCGLDFSKAVIISDDSYIAGEAIVDRKEWDIINRNEHIIVYRFKQYISQYKRAARRRDNPHSMRYLRYSSLQYFEQELGIE